MDRRLVGTLAALIAAGGAFGMAGVRRHRFADTLDEEDMPPETEPRMLGDALLTLPIVYHRSESFGALFSADYQAVRDSLPSTTLQPLRIGPGRCAFAVQVLQHHEASVQAASGETVAARPNGEVILGPLVSTHRLPPLLPFMRPGPLSSSIGLLVQHMPVTTREARDLGRAIWGFPKFVADMDFSETQDVRTLSVSEGDANILTFSVAHRGPVHLERTSAVLYSMRGDELVRTACPTVGYARRRLRGFGSLSLGAHPVAEDLRRLRLSTSPFATETTVLQRLVLPEGVVAGRGVPYSGYPGTDRELGRYTVAYPQSVRIDQYMDRPAVSPVSGAWSAG